VPEFGYGLAAILDYSLSGRFALVTQPGVVKNSMSWESGWLADPQTSQAGMRTEERVIWLDLPISARYTVNPKSRHRISLGVGVSARRHLSSKSEATFYSSGSYLEGPLFDTGDSWRNWAFFGVSEAGLDFSLGKRSLGFSVAFEPSLTKLMNPPDPVEWASYGYVTRNIKLKPLTLASRFVF
jgi:hypothetical protein